MHGNPRYCQKGQTLSIECSYMSIQAYEFFHWHICMNTYCSISNLFLCMCYVPFRNISDSRIGWSSKSRYSGLGWGNFKEYLESSEMCVHSRWQYKDGTCTSAVGRHSATNCTIPLWAVLLFFKRAFFHGMVLYRFCGSTSGSHTIGVSTVPTPIAT